MKKNETLFNRIEPILFLLITLINLSPVLFVKYFPTVDGPAHLYNANLITELWKDPTGVLSRYFILDDLLTTNLTDHYFFVLSGLFLPGYLSEKILMVFYLTGLPLAYRYFILSIKPQGVYLAYFIFPFTYSFLFFYGFFNFHIALVFFFISLGYIKKFLMHPCISRGLLLMILVTVVCLSHAFVFGMLILILVIMQIPAIRSISLADNQENNQEQIIRKFFLLAIVLAPAVILALISSAKSQVPPLSNDWIPFTQLLKWIRQIQPAKGISYGRENIYTTWLFYLLVLLTLITFFKTFFYVSKVNNHIRIGLNRNSGVWKYNYLFPASLIILLLYFILPDIYHQYWSFISSRLLLFFFLLFIAWIASGEMLLCIRLPVLLIILIMNSYLLGIYVKEGKELNRAALEAEKAATYITPYSTVLPVDQSGKWIYGHFSNYLGIDKPMIILENYEAELDYFPVNWNNDLLPHLLFGEADSLKSCLNWKSNFDNEPERIKYVFMIKNITSESQICNDMINNILNNSYQLIYQNNSHIFELYRLIPDNGVND